MFLDTIGMALFAAFFTSVGYFWARLRRSNIEKKMFERLLKLHFMIIGLMEKLRMVPEEDNDNNSEE